MLKLTRKSTTISTHNNDTHIIKPSSSKQRNQQINIKKHNSNKSLLLKQQKRHKITFHQRSQLSSQPSISPSTTSSSSTTSTTSPSSSSSLFGLKLKYPKTRSLLSSSSSLQRFSTFNQQHNQQKYNHQPQHQSSLTSSLLLSSSQRSFSTQSNNTTGATETIEDAFTQFFGYESTLNFTTFKNDFCSLIQYLDHIFESNEFKDANYIQSGWDKGSINPQAINGILGQYPMYIAELSTPIEITGRSHQQRKKHVNPIGEHSSYGNSILELPPFLHFHCPELNQLFFTPQQTILLFGTFTAAIYEHVQKLENEPKISSDEIFQQLANELSIEKEHLIKILSKCYELVFNGHRPCSSHNLIYTSPATGTSTLYSILSILFHHLNIPFVYCGFARVMILSNTDVCPFDYRGFYYAPKQSKKIKMIKNIYISSEHSNHRFPFNLFDQSTIILMDNKDETYHPDEWGKHRSALDRDLLSHPQIKPTIFTFGTAEDQMIKNDDKYYVYLYNSGIYPYYYSPSMLNFKLGITQLQLFRHYQQQFKSLSLLLPPPPPPPSTTTTNTTESASTTSIIDSTQPLQSNQHQQQIVITNQPQSQEQSQKQQQHQSLPLTFEQQQSLYQLYFGQNLQQLMNEYQTEFEQLLISASKTATQQMSLSSTTVSSTPQINQILQSQLINNPKYYPLLYNIIYHPMSDILATKQSMIISTRDTKEILSRIINDIQIDDINQVLLPTLQTTSSIPTSTSTSESKSSSKSQPTTNTVEVKTSSATTTTTTKSTTKSTKSKSTTKSNNNKSKNKTETPPTQSSISKLPSLYLVPKSTNISDLNIDTNQFNNTTLLEQYWKQFQLTTIASTSTTQTEQQQEQEQRQQQQPEQQQTIEPNQTPQSSQSSQSSSSLYTLIHNLWFDLSIFTLYGLPTHRFVSLLASKPNSENGQYSHLVEDYLDYQVCQISPHVHIGMIFLNGPKYFYKTRVERDFDFNDTLVKNDLYKRKLQRGNYFKTIDRHNIVKLNPSHSTNWLNNIIAFSERFDCYLPFEGFNSQPIRKIISYNNMYGIQQPISSMIEQCDPEISNDDFDAQIINSMRYGVTIIIPPSKYKYADVIIKQRESILFIRFGELSLPEGFQMEKAIITKNYNYEYVEADLYQTNVVFDNHTLDVKNMTSNDITPKAQCMKVFTSPSIVSESSQITSNTNPTSIPKVVKYTKIDDI